MRDPKAMGFNTKMLYLGMNLGVHAILGNMQLCLKELMGECWVRDEVNSMLMSAMEVYEIRYA